MGEMQDQSDAQLLSEYAESRSEAAFREIVVRHTDLVFSSALRQVASPDLACDVAQSVFTDLSRKAPLLAGTLTGNSALLGWLYRSTRYAALNLLRDNRRRQARERQVMEYFNPVPETTPDWENIRPVLDEAMADLSDEDREAVLLRYFKRNDLHTVGAALGVSEDAAQKRVSRAVDRLREFFAKRGVTIGASGLAVVLSANAVQAAPVGLAATLCTAAALAGTTVATTATAIKAIAMTTLQKTLITATIVAAVGTGIYEGRHASSLRNQVQLLQQQQASLGAQIEQLQYERDDATNRLALLAGEMAETKSNSAEQLKLRGKVTRLEMDAQELPELKAKLSRFEDTKAAQMRSFRELQEHEALVMLGRIKAGIKLAPGQDQALQDLLLKRADLIVQDMQEMWDGARGAGEGSSQSMSNLNAQIDAVFLPAQQADYKALQQDGNASGAHLHAAGELMMMQSLVGITAEQQDQVFPILYNFALKRNPDDSTESPEITNALDTVLTPEQMQSYLKFMLGKKINTSIGYPTK